VAVRATASRPAGPPASALTCPRCKRGPLVTGKRGWGCSRWREGCSFVVWFETAGRRLSDAQLRDLIAKGKTRKATFNPPGAPESAGRLVLDVNGSSALGGARFEPV
jgi:DNA topoisomerase-3